VSKSKLDIATPLGFFLGLGSLAGSVILEHGSLMAYFNVSAGLIVFGGSIGIAFIANPTSVVLGLPKVMMKTMRDPVENPAVIVQQFIALAERARKEGLLALEQEAANISDPMIKKGVMLVVDGTDPEMVKQVLESRWWHGKRVTKWVSVCLRRWVASPPPWASWVR
jgi:chemotaxis protein MotA